MLRLAASACLHVCAACSGKTENKKEQSLLERQVGLDATAVISTALHMGMHVTALSCISCCRHDKH